MKKYIDVNDLKIIQLEMLRAFDAFCKANSFTYYLTYGTLIGALRHKGYIHWDEDVYIRIKRVV